MSSLRETYVSLEIKDDASNSLMRIDRLVNDINRNFQVLGNQIDGSTNGFGGMSQEVVRLNNRLDSATNVIGSMQTAIVRSNREMLEMRNYVSRIEQELQGARQEIHALNQGTQQLNNNAKQASRSFGDLASSVTGIAASLGSLSFGASLVSEAIEMDTAFGRLQARTGATADELEEYKAIAKGVFVGGFTENIAEASDSVSTFGAMFQDLGTGDLSKVVTGAHTISKAWDQEAKQVGKTVSTMTKTFEGLSETEALDLITVGFQRTGDHSEDLLDTFNEYSTQFKALGYDAEGFTATLIAGAESGAFNFDKLADTAKEGFLKMGEGSKDTRSALVAMGLDADQVINGIGQGGDEAQKAFMGVSTALASVEDPAKRTELAIAAFGTPIEDLGPQFATFFGSVNQDLGDFEGATQRASDSMMNRFGPRMTSAWRDLKLSIIDAFSGEGTQNFLGTLADDIEGALPSIKAGLASFGETISNNIIPAYNTFKTGLNWLITNGPIIGAVAVGIGAGFATFKVVTTVSAGLSMLSAALAAYRTAGLMAAAAQLGLNTAMLASPLTWIVVGIAAVVAAGILLYQNWDTVKVKAGELWGVVQTVFGSIYDWGASKIQGVTGFFGGLVDKVSEFIGKITNFKMPEWVTNVGGAIGGAIDKVGSFISGSHATGLASVPYNGYVAELHKDEAVLTAQQSNALRSAGILSGNSNGTPNLNLGSGIPTPSFATSNASVSANVPEVNPMVSTSAGTDVHLSMPIEIIIQGNADSSTIEQIKAAMKQLEATFGTKVRQIIEEIFAKELAGLEG